MTPEQFSAECFSIALTFGLSPDRVVADLTGDEDCTPYEFVDRWVDRLDRDNVRAQEDAAHTEAEIREIYREHGL